MTSATPPARPLCRLSRCLCRSRRLDTYTGGRLCGTKRLSYRWADSDVPSLVPSTPNLGSQSRSPSEDRRSAPRGWVCTSVAPLPWFPYTGWASSCVPTSVGAETPTQILFVLRYCRSEVSEALDCPSADESTPQLTSPGLKKIPGTHVTGREFRVTRPNLTRGRGDSPVRP